MLVILSVSSVPVIFNSLMLYLAFRLRSKTISTSQECEYASPVTLNWLLKLQKKQLVSANVIKESKSEKAPLSFTDNRLNLALLP